MPINDNNNNKQKEVFREKGGQNPLARPDQEPILRRVLGSSLDFASGHGTGGERKKAPAKTKKIRRDQHNTSMGETKFNCTANPTVKLKIQ